ncbi:MAG: hypothetical protein DRH90_15315 [Deltaproteobacteria bacterium]|nr:MAG: hypothetical protein DRH90_15315 [Deltaproteobacteria bacterium]RLC10072.1 MAG: hypothetical protein DRI24_20835 [Deltaproteobacteria bacterium]
MSLSGNIYELFGITGSMDLRQFHFRTGITHPLSGLPLLRIWDLEIISKDMIKNGGRLFVSGTAAFSRGGSI